MQAACRGGDPQNRLILRDPSDHVADRDHGDRADRRSRSAPASLPQLARRLEDGLRVGPGGDAIGVRYPADRSLAIEQYARGARDIGAAVSALMEQTITLEDHLVRVAEERKAEPQIALHLGGVLRGINADRDDLHVRRIKLALLARQTGELRTAERSPRSSVKDEERLVPAQRGEREGAALLVREREIRSRRAGGDHRRGRGRSRLATWITKRNSAVASVASAALTVATARTRLSR